MNGKPKSSAAAGKIVAHCKHPDLDGSDKALLMYLVLNGDFIAGTNCHPGNRNLADAIGLKDRATDNRLTKNIARGLIQRTERADGRGKASTYRICWESPYYPDRTPAGEPLTEEARVLSCADSDESQKEPRSLQCADSSITAQAVRNNRAPEDPKPRTEEGETAHRRVPTTIHALPTHHPPTIQTASSKTESAGWKGWILLPTTTDLMGIPTDKEQQELKTLASKEPHGFEYLKKAVRKFRDREQGFGGLTKVSPWRLFINQGTVAMTIAKAELMDSGEWRREHIPGEREFFEASIARQTAENQAVWNAGPQQNEESVEDFFGNARLTP